MLEQGLTLQITNEQITTKRKKQESYWYFIVYIKTNDIYKDIAKNVETRFDTSNYE